MKTFLLLLFAALSFNCFSQSVGGVQIADIKSEYIQIVGTGKALSTKVKIEIDFGQFDNMWSAKDKIILDADGSKLELNSMIDALNFFSKYGYGFVQAYTISVGSQSVYHYLLRKKNP